jgi:hypothetical protein
MLMYSHVCLGFERSVGSALAMGSCTWVLQIGPAVLNDLRSWKKKYIII